MRAEKVLAVSVFLVTFIYLFPQIPSHIAEGDSGELIASARILGNAHPPGYPLYSLAGKIFISFAGDGNSAYAMNFMQGFFGAAAAMLIFILIYILAPRFIGHNQDRIAAALFGAFLFTAGSIFIEQAVYAEVFMLNLAVMLMVLVAAVRQKYMAAGFIAGLGLGNQHTLVLVFPALIYSAVASSRNMKEFYVSCVKFFILMLAGLTVYGYLPVRAAASPPINWGDPLSLNGFIAVITRRAYGSFSLHASPSVFTFHKAWSILAYFTRGIAAGTCAAGALLAAAGLFVLFRRSSRTAAILLVIFAVAGPGFFLVANMEPDAVGRAVLRRFFLMPYAVMPLMASAVFAVRGRLKYALFALPVLLGAANFIPASGRPAVLSRYLEDVVSTLGRGEPLYITRGGVGDDIVFGMAYLKWGEGRLKDLEIFSEYASIFPAPGSRIPARASFSTFNSAYRGKPLYQKGLLFSTYRSSGSYPDYLGPGGAGSRFSYRQRNIAVNYPFFHGRWLFSHQRYGEGEKDFEKAREMGGDIPWLYNNIGNVYRESGMDRRAVDSYLRAVELDPYMAEPYNNMGNIYFRQGDYGRAAAMYRTAIAVEPDPQRYYNLGLAYLNMEEYAKAKEAAGLAVKLAPEYADAYNVSGLADLRRGRYESAADIFTRAYNLSPGNSDILFNTALAYEKMGSPRADSYWRLYLKRAPADDPDRRTAQWYLQD